MRGRAPEQPESREVEGEEGKLGADVAAGDLLVQGPTGHEGERPARVKLDQQHWPLVVTGHGEALAVEAPVVQGADQVADALALHAHVWSQNIIADL